MKVAHLAVQTVESLVEKWADQMVGWMVVKMGYRLVVLKVASKAA